MSIEQCKNESLRTYIDRFSKEALKVHGLDEKVAMIALQQGTTDVYFKMSLSKHASQDMNQLQERAGKYIKAEESMKKSHPQPDNDKKRKKDSSYNARDKFQRGEKSEKSTPRKLGAKFSEYTRHNAPRSQILMDIKKDKDLKWPMPLKSDPEKRNQNLFCRYHKEVEHNNDDCIQLKNEIEYLIRQGKLNKYTKDGNNDNQDNRHNWNNRGNNDKRPQPRGPVVNIISGGPTAAGTTSNSRKAYAREVLQIVGGPPKKAKTEVTISFGDEDLEGIKFPHDDHLVIMLVIGNSSVKRILVDGGASMDILFHEAFLRMGYNDSQLTHSDMPIYGFNGAETKVEGIIQLPITMGQKPYEVTQMLNFIVIKVVSSYNAILGRTGISAFQAITST